MNWLFTEPHWSEVENFYKNSLLIEIYIKPPTYNISPLCFHLTEPRGKWHANTKAYQKTNLEVQKAVNVLTS